MTLADASHRRIAPLLLSAIQTPPRGFVHASPNTSPICADVPGTPLPEKPGSPVPTTVDAVPRIWRIRKLNVSATYMGAAGPQSAIAPGVVSMALVDGPPSPP